MKLSPNLRVLTIGDGDLSFSNALRLHHQPQSLCATVFDSCTALASKYSLAHYDQLVADGVTVLTEFDVTNPNSWNGLVRNTFDLVIFQFPLLPNDGCAATHQQSKVVGDQNLRHRRLLHKFLHHAQLHFLDKEGARLMIITSKDVKPYRQWDIEHALVLNSSINYLGHVPFNVSDFPGYDIRNVDRDKFVKQTQGVSYYYSDKSQPELAQHLHIEPHTKGQHSEQFCAMCRVGPMLTQGDITAHQQSKRHRQMSEFDRNWRHYLEQAGERVD